MEKTREQLMNFVPSYRAGYLSAGGPNRDETDEQVVEKMDKAGVLNELDAETRGRKDGFEERAAAQKKK